MAPTQNIDYPCPTCNSPMALVRVSPLDRQCDLRFLKCEVCKCEVCSHIEKNQGVKNQSETGMISAAIERPRGDNTLRSPLMRLQGEQDVKSETDPRGCADGEFKKSREKLRVSGMSGRLKNSRVFEVILPRGR